LGKAPWDLGFLPCGTGNAPRRRAERAAHP